MESYFITVDWMDSNGNPRTSSSHVFDKKNAGIDRALEHYTSRVRKFKNCCKVNGGSAVKCN
jgi:hypothetical protein